MSALQAEDGVSITPDSTITGDIGSIPVHFQQFTVAPKTESILKVKADTIRVTVRKGWTHLEIGPISVEK